MLPRDNHYNGHLKHISHKLKRGVSFPKWGKVFPKQWYKIFFCSSLIPRDVYRGKGVMSTLLQNHPYLCPVICRSIDQNRPKLTSPVPPLSMSSGLLHQSKVDIRRRSEFIFEDAVHHRIRRFPASNNLYASPILIYQIESSDLSLRTYILKGD